MRFYRCITVVICVLTHIAAMVWAQDHISEEDFVSALQGKPRAGAPGQPFGAAIHVTFPSQTSARVQGKRALSSGHPQADAAVYKTLIPLARALEAEVLRGSRFVVRIEASLPLPVEYLNELGRQLADTVEHFLTTYFSIPHERLSLQVSLPDPTAAGLSIPSPGPQRWRLDVLRWE